MVEPEDGQFVAGPFESLACATEPPQGCGSVSLLASSGEMRVVVSIYAGAGTGGRATSSMTTPTEARIQSRPAALLSASQNERIAQLHAWMKWEAYAAAASHEVSSDDE